uniref:DUF1981 domain-containing protein n=1 Tax=Ascaris lumbricoides TaxID=6252 RepID=A0A0M3IRF7_ASCLU
MFPLNAPCCAAELHKSDSAKQFTDVWKRLYTSIQAANAREASGSSFSYAIRVATNLASTFENSRDSAKQFTDIWKRLYTSIQAANAREASGNSFSYAIRVATNLASTFENSRANNEVLLTGSYLLRIVIETLPFAALGESANNEVLLTGSYLLRIVIETLPFAALGESVFEGCFTGAV